MLLEFFAKKRRRFNLQSFALGIVSGLVLVFIVALAYFRMTVGAAAYQEKEISQKIVNEPLAEIDLAAEIYPEFFCPCCGKPLDPEAICCGAMSRMIDYIDEAVAAGLSKEEIIMKAAKEFGINSLVSEETIEWVKNQLIANAPADAPQIVFAQESLDLGEVSQAKGEAIAYFDIRNEGKSELVIEKLTSSCGCTSASIVYQGEEGPKFTMPGHGKENPKNWSVSIAPGDSAQLKVYYDPNAHGKQKEAILPITRTVSVFSNDPVEFEKKVRIELNQMP